VRVRISGPNESTMSPTNGVRAADLAEQYDLTSEEAINAIAVSQQVKSLRSSGMRRLEILSLLTERAKKEEDTSKSVNGTLEIESVSHASSTPADLSDTTQPVHNKTSSSSPSTCSSSSSSSSTTSASPSPPLPTPLVQSSSSPTSRPRPFPSTTNNGQQSVAEGAVIAPMKRSRSVEKMNINLTRQVKEAVENEVDLELGRLLTGLSTEINEAMRSGDRSKVAVLMRQRDQLRLNRGNSLTMSNDSDVAQGALKRTKSSSRSS
jgi:hypothetical protein